jgi:FolB domain-containing protein
VLPAGPVLPAATPDLAGPEIQRRMPREADCIEIRGLRLLCTVGVDDQERARAQPIEIDLDLVLDDRRGAGDDLARTADYAAVLDAVAAVVTGSSYRLLESLAEAVASVALDRPHVEQVTVRLGKLQPPVPFDLSSAGVRITRLRP